MNGKGFSRCFRVAGLVSACGCAAGSTSSPPETKPEPVDGRAATDAPAAEDHPAGRDRDPDSTMPADHPPDLDGVKDTAADVASMPSAEVWLTTKDLASHLSPRPGIAFERRPVTPTIAVDERVTYQP